MSSLEQVARVCQLVAGEAIAWSCPPAPAALGGRFRGLATPASRAEHLAIERLLERFVADLAERVHTQFHRRFGAGCARATPAAQTICIEHRSVARAVAGWAERHRREFLQAHLHMPGCLAAYIEQDPCASNGELAAACGCNTRTLERRVLQLTGSTITAFQQRARVRRALTLLADGMKVEAVANTVGWRSKKDLYRAFRICNAGLPGAVKNLHEAELAQLQASLVSVPCAAVPGARFTARHESRGC